jgi:hypothetical protein
MKKTIVIALILAFVALPVSAMSQKATLINADGQKIVVTVGSSQAQFYLDHGFSLMGAPKLGLALPNAVWTKTNILGTSLSPFSMASTTLMKPQNATSTVLVGFGYDSLSLNVKIINASSTKASALTITPGYSNDDACNTVAGNATTTMSYADSGAATSTVNWFWPSDINTNYTGNNQGVTTISAAASKVVFQKFTIRDLFTRCIRFVFSDTNASTTAFIEGLMK